MKTLLTITAIIATSVLTFAQGSHYTSGHYRKDASTVIPFSRNQRIDPRSTVVSPASSEPCT